MKYMPAIRANASSSVKFGSRLDGIKHYRVPAGLSLEEKFEHWRSWYGSAINTPARLEKTEQLVPARFDPTAISLDAPGFSLVDVRNEPASCHWSAPASPQYWLVYFRSSCAGFSFAGRTEEVSPGSVRFLDHSSPGSFYAPSGLSAVRIQFDRHLLGLDDKSMKRLQALADVRDNPLVRGLVLPALASWQQADLDREVPRLQPVFRSMMAALIASLLEAPVDDANIKLARIAAIKKFIRRNFRNPALDVNEVVAYSFLSRRSLYYLFEHEDLPVNGYIRALRTSEALALLTDHNSWRLSLRDVAQASGFTNVQALPRAVRESTGLSLSDVQENAKQLQKHAAELEGSQRLTTTAVKNEADSQ